MGQKCCRCCRRHKPSHASSRPPEDTPYTVVDFVVALHQYRAAGDTELSFNNGDTLEVLDKDDEDWWLARHPGHSHIGYIPVPFVALSSSLESHEWYHGEMTRVEAEQVLMSRLNSPGAFLVRKSHRVNSYVLSVKSFASDGYTPRVKHFNVSQTDNNYLVFGGRTFLTLSDLVEHFVTKVEAGLPKTMSKHPCARLTPTMQDISREMRDQWEIPSKELNFVRKIGQGSFGEVWLGRWRGVTDVAIKTMKEGKMNASDFLEEAKVMKSLRHTNILALYAVCTREEPLLIVTEFMSKGALLDLLRTEHLNLQLQLYIATQVAAGMSYLEREQLIHRDLAARNILVGECYVCKVADFGLSKLLEDAIYAGRQSRQRLPVKWTAPEALLHQKYTSKSDVWSFGVMLMEIVTHGAVPYPGFSNKELVESICQGYRMPQPARCPAKVYELVLHSWDRDPNKRPTFYFIHDYLENFDVQSENSYCETEEI